MAVKYIFVTGGVVSGLGKGITAASLGRLLKARGYKVHSQKFDPYINIDPGTMNPIQHGEVFVTDDGAETDLALRQEWGGEWTPYALELTCQVYQTDHLVSIAAQYYSNTGGAHPNTCLLAWNFDLETGTFFGSDQLAGNGEFRKTVSEELIRQARETAETAEMEPEMYFWQDYADIIEDWHNYAVSFDETGMTVAFSPYELACYAAGPQVFHVTYDYLLPHLGEQGQTILGLETAE